jgi:cell division protein FtsW
MNTFRYGVLPYILILGADCGLLVLEPHISATVIMILLAGTMLFIGGVRLRWFGMAFAAVGAAVAYLVIFTKDFTYANDRLVAWLDPFTTNPDLMADTWQTRQSLYAIGSGGLLGLGLGQSRQKYLYLPEPQNDFVFAIVCEELGFIGALIIIILFALLVWRGITISLKAKDKFGMLLGIGLSVQIGLQVILNIAVVTNTIPNTGIGLPFFSYGGSSLVVLLAQMGIVLSISRTSAIEKT